MGLNLDPSVSGPTVGFFKLVSTSGRDGFLGALLVTDCISKPLEFRVTLPVKPNPVQRTPYGPSLIPHVGVDLCGRPLYEILETKPSLLLVEDERLLRLSQAIPGHVVLVRPEENRAETAQGEPQETILSDPNGRFPSIAVSCPSDYDSLRCQEALRLVKTMFSHIDLLEPFQRVENAVRVLAQEDERFR